MSFWVPNTAGELPEDGGGGVTQIVAGANVIVDPPGGTGVVTVSGADPGAGGGSGGDSNIPSLYNDALGNPFVGWSWGPIGAGGQNNQSPQNQQVCLTSVYLPKDVTVGHLTFLYTGKGGGFGTNHNFLGLYRPLVSGGVLQRLDLIGATAPGALDAVLIAYNRTVNTLALSGGPFALTAGFYYTAMLMWYSTAAPETVSWTPPILGTPLTDTFMPHPPSVNGGGNQPSLPATIATFGSSQMAFWAGLS